MSDEQDLKDRLAKALKDHDWYYQMSDDSRFWREGNTEAQNISAMMQSLEKMVGSRQANAFWNEHAPERFFRRVPEES